MPKSTPEIEIDHDEISLIREALTLESPIVFEASCMDHGQGAEMLLLSHSHKELFDAAHFDISSWLYDLFNDLIDKEGFWWAGNGFMKIAHSGEELFLEATFTKGYYNECSSPFEEHFLSSFEQKLSAWASNIRPDVNSEWLNLKFTTDFEYMSEKKINKNKIVVEVENTDDSGIRFSRVDEALLGSEILSHLLRACKVWEEEIDSCTDSSWIRLKMKNLYQEDFCHEANYDYGALVRYKLDVR